MIRWIVKGGAKSKDVSVDDIREASSCSDCKSREGVRAEGISTLIGSVVGNEVRRFYRSD